MKPRLLGMLLLALACGSANAASITYNVNRTVGAGGVVGTITTDGTIGDISVANIASFSLVASDGIDSFLLASPGGANVAMAGPARFSATSTDLLFDFTAAGEILFFASGGFEQWYLRADLSYEQINHIASGHPSQQRGYSDADPVVIGTTSVVPAPAAVWLFGSALGLMGVMRREISS